MIQKVQRCTSFCSSSLPILNLHSFFLFFLSSPLSSGKLLSARNDGSASDSYATDSLPTYTGQAIVQENRRHQKRKKEMTHAAINFNACFTELSYMFVTTVTVLSIDLILYALYHCSFDDADITNCPV